MANVRLSWKPLSHGKTHCSPGCGAGCTRAAYNQAKRKAQALARKLGRGWKGEVWENMGWYYKAVSKCGRIAVHEDVGGIMHGDPPVSDCTAFLNKPHQGGGRWFARGSDPVSAVLRVVADMREDLASFKDLMEPERPTNEWAGWDWYDE